MPDRTWTYPLDAPSFIAAFGMHSILGVTGRAEGLLDTQRGGGMLLLSWMVPTELHHGDCVGWDVFCARAAVGFGVRTVVAHPPDNDYMRAFHPSEIVLPTKPYMVRNTDIAHSAQALIAAPSTDDEIVRSGIWATIRRGRKAGIPIAVLAPTRAWVELPDQESMR